MEKYQVQIKPMCCKTEDLGRGSASLADGVASCERRFCLARSTRMETDWIYTYALED